MSKATGLITPTATYPDRNSILVGPVRAGEGVAAENRDGSARLLDSINLRNANWLKFVGMGATVSAAGGYFIQVHHVPQGGSLPAGSSANWIQIGILTFSGKDQREIGFTGLQIEQIIRAAHTPAIAANVDVRINAVRLVAGTGTGTGQNGLAVPPGFSGCTVFFQRS
jgi:hypothetical protein